MIGGASTEQTEWIWNGMYPTEPYRLEQSCSLLVRNVETQRSIHYDLVESVKRQSPFFKKVIRERKWSAFKNGLREPRPLLLFVLPFRLYCKSFQVSISIMHDDHFLEESVARYRGFLHLMKRKEEGSAKGLCVPTCDIDLIWHSHQLYPVSYCNDLEATIGKIVDHNDRDFDSPMLRIGFVQTTRLWEDTYGRQYLRGGAMYEGADCAKCYSCGVISTAWISQYGEGILNVNPNMWMPYIYWIK